MTPEERRKMLERAQTLPAIGLYPTGKHVIRVEDVAIVTYPARGEREAGSLLKLRMLGVSPIIRNIMCDIILSLPQYEVIPETEEWRYYPLVYIADALKLDNVELCEINAEIMQPLIGQVAIINVKSTKGNSGKNTYDRIYFQPKDSFSLGNDATTMSNYNKIKHTLGETPKISPQIVDDTTTTDTNEMW